MKKYQQEHSGDPKIYHSSKSKSKKSGNLVSAQQIQNQDELLNETLGTDNGHNKKKIRSRRLEKDQVQLSGGLKMYHTPKPKKSKSASGEDMDPQINNQDDLNCETLETNDG